MARDSCQHTAPTSSTTAVPLSHPLSYRCTSMAIQAFKHISSVASTCFQSRLEAASAALAAIVLKVVVPSSRLSPLSGRTSPPKTSSSPAELASGRIFTEDATFTTISTRLSRR
eukprot:79709-Prorocentrum_minimum.AAC.2